MPLLDDEQVRNSRTWSVATWSLPFVVQLVLGALLASMWLLGKWPFATNESAGGERSWLLAATLIATLAALIAAGALAALRSERSRGLAISFAGSSAVVLTGGVTYAFWIYS